MILWSTPRELAPLGKIRVWVVHLALFDVRTVQVRTLTSGVSYDSDFFWCTSEEKPHDVVGGSAKATIFDPGAAAR